MNLTLPVSGAWRTTAIDLGQWLPGGSADGRNRRNPAVHRCPAKVSYPPVADPRRLTVEQPSSGIPGACQTTSDPRSTYWFPRKLSPRASRTPDPERDVPGRLTRRGDWRLPRAVPRLAVPRLASMPILRARSNPEGDPRQDPAGAGARAVATPAEAICPATGERSKETTRWALTGRLRHSLCGRVRMNTRANSDAIAVRLQRICHRIDLAGESLRRRRSRSIPKD